MEKEPSKLVELVERFYRMVKLSGLFWLQLAKNALVYGLFSSLYSGFVFLANSDLQSARFTQVMKDTRSQLPYHRLLSFCWFLLLSSLGAGFWFTSCSNQGLQLWLFAGSLFLQIWTIYLIWLAYVAQRLQGALAYAQALNLLIRHPMISLSMWVLLWGCIVIGYLNIPLFLLVAPGLTLTLWRKLLRRPTLDVDPVLEQKV